MLGYNVSVPPYVRQALFSRSFDNDDLLPKIRKPVLITHGADDAVVKPAAVDQHKARSLTRKFTSWRTRGTHPFGITQRHLIRTSEPFLEVCKCIAPGKHASAHCYSRCHWGIIFGGRA